MKATRDLVERPDARQVRDPAHDRATNEVRYVAVGVNPNTN